MRLSLFIRRRGQSGVEPPHSKAWIARAMSLCLLSACAGGPTGADTPVVIVDGIDNTAQLRTVQLRTMEDLHTMRGQRISLVRRADVDLAKLAELEKSGEFSSFQAFYGQAEQEVTSEPARPSLLWQGGRWVPRDFDSLMLVTAYAHLEEIMAFFRTVVRDESGATKNPLSVGLYATVHSGGKLSLGDLSGNAFYSRLPDMLFVLRTGAERWLPYGLNKTVLAHEFAHRVFQYNVWVRQPQVQQYVWASPGRYLQGNPTLLFFRATDEGLADLAAILFTGDPSAFGYAFRGGFNGQTRDLQSSFAQEATYDKLMQTKSPFAQQWQCHYSEDAMWYCLGTVLVRTLLDAAAPEGSMEEKITRLRQHFAPLLPRILQDVGSYIAASQGYYGINVFFHQAVSRLRQVDDSSSRQLALHLCEATRKRFTSLTNPGMLPACFVPVEVEVRHGEQGEKERKDAYFWWPDYEKGEHKRVLVEFKQQDPATGREVSRYIPMEVTGSARLRKQASGVSLDLGVR
ncbi:MAG: hypothetical protein AAF471_00555 [Myxococcota bacterium]